jgi:hypothetical protein
MGKPGDPAQMRFTWPASFGDRIDEATWAMAQLATV